jgi:hypothetical protein
MSSLVFHIEADKADTNILESIKAFFGSQKVEIFVKSEKALTEIIEENYKSNVSYVFSGNEFDEVAEKILNDESPDFEPYKKVKR